MLLLLRVPRADVFKLFDVALLQRRMHGGFYDFMAFALVCFAVLIYTTCCDSAGCALLGFWKDTPLVCYICGKKTGSHACIVCSGFL